ncbi:MAG: sigma-54-dependent Fis family transcriptional regulator [PVC group bacterium]|nr:sigma-54-dependent Fis family transcriptional regulator [PVC group bacterium]
MERLVNTQSGKHSLVGRSNSMLTVYELIEKISPVDVGVLLIGESGTGKELAAHAIHGKSARKDMPFVAVNCAAIPDTLAESELFGHEKGAFTGAQAKRKGKFELADKGTLFLDEIGDMSLEAQSKMLRILEEKKLETVGGEQSILVDIRIIAASNKDLLQKVKERTFRSDLYYRLNEMRIDLPPLRERKEDISLLVKHFIELFNQDFNKKVKGVSDTALSYLIKHSWPGNVRELKNVIKRAIALMESEVIWLEHLPFEVRLQAKDYLKDDFSLKQIERCHIAAILNKTKWNKKMAAMILEISRPRLDRKIKEYNLTEGK